MVSYGTGEGTVEVVDYYLSRPVFCFAYYHRHENDHHNSCHALQIEHGVEHIFREQLCDAERRYHPREQSRVGLLQLKRYFHREVCVPDPSVEMALKCAVR